MSKRPQNRPRLTDRAYELAERLDPSGNRSRAIEVALEVLAQVEFRQFGPEGPGHGECTDLARNILATREHEHRDFALVRLAQGLEMFAMASGLQWPDGSVGLRGLAEWLNGLGPDESATAKRWDQLSSGDEILAVLRGIHKKAAPGRDADSETAGPGNPDARESAE